jgi:hypothetical protein
LGTWSNTDRTPWNCGTHFIFLGEVGRLIGNLDYAVVSKAITRFQRRMQTDPKLREQLVSYDQ